MIRDSFRSASTVHLFLDCAAFFVLVLVVSSYTIVRRVLVAVVVTPKLLLLAMSANLSKEAKKKTTLKDLFHPKKSHQHQQQPQEDAQHSGNAIEEDIVSTEQEDQPHRGESPVSLSFSSSPEATAPDESEDELVTLRSRVRELEAELQETQHVLRSTRQALVLKTEQFHSLFLLFSLPRDTLLHCTQHDRGRCSRRRGRRKTPRAVRAG